MGRRLLIVDDDARVTELLSRYLASVGYLTSCSLDAATAISLSTNMSSICWWWIPYPISPAGK